LVDPIGAVFKLRRKMLRQHSLKGLFFELISLIRGRDMEKYALKYLKEYDLILQHAYHHAEELKNDGFKNVHYLPHPLPVPKLENLAGIKKPDIFDSGLVTVLIAGSLKGASSRVGFQFFLSEILPGLLNRNSEIIFPYKFRIVGHGKMLPSLKKRVEEVENLKFIGFVKNIEEEYQRADIMLVAIPVKHGFRTRIAEAFSYGMCVVAHGANCEGMPEIKDGYNALAANDPEILTSKLIEAINNPDLRIKLGRNARKTFINNLSIDVATKKLSKLLDDFLPVAKKNIKFVSKSFGNEFTNKYRI
ncbi:MAG: glycosyltransferase family 4 protein, partial [Solirubrobacterales bacterium]|nr:glycosyltransferase family 4 protein [Solirubrobacterales bacterium]